MMRVSSPCLPDDLLAEILSRLSVKSLLQLRCVSNSWLNCIDDPKFARLHFNRYNNNISVAESHLFAQFRISSSFLPQFALWCSTTLTTTARLDPPTENYTIISMLDGLFVILNEKTREKFIWNPSIQKARLIPKCSEIPKRASTVVHFGLGFSSAINDYKYVIMLHSWENGLEFFAVYTFSTSSWKIVEFHIDGRRPAQPVIFPIRGSKSVSIGSVMYSINMFGNPDVLSFDCDSNRFGSFSLPDDYTSFDHGLPILALGGKGRSLALLRVSHVEGRIWIRQTTSWDKCFRFTFTFPPDYHPMYSPYRRMLHLNINNELLLDWKTVLTLINIDTKEEKIIPKTDGLCSVMGVWRYTESLFMLN